MSNHPTRSVENAARKFFSILVPLARFDYTDHPAKPLVVAAFQLYADAWKGNGYRIGQWEYPFTVLREGGANFDGDRPWTVLLRRAVEISLPLSHG